MLTRIGPYTVEREIGRGGMGVVYLARDARLERMVAIKALPEAFARDPERLARFEREARLLASLTHTHIAGIYGIEEIDGHRYLALEYVEGETLAERLNRGPLALDETLDVCRQVAAALEAAHEAGIVHRDLKPGNIKLTPGGEVKVLDFGLAKGASAGADSSPDLTQSPTMTQAATGAGVILGTAAYMSPEQARGRIVDRRTDIWSFGCVLYECLTGQQAFAGETVSDMIALILQGEADWSRLPKGTPERLRALLARCLEKDARRRLRDIGEARIELEALQAPSGPGRLAHHGNGAAAVAGSAPSGGSPWRTIAFAAALVLAGAVATTGVWMATGGHRAPPTLRFMVQPPPRATLLPEPPDQVISPDGTMLAMVATDSAGQVGLWVRPLQEFEARLVPGTHNAELPFWSPDSKQIAFFADGKLRRVRVAGGMPEVICDAAASRGGSWSRKGVIVFGPSPTGPLVQVRASGGQPAPVTALDSTRAETAHRWPSFLPDDEHFLYTALPAKNGLFSCYVGSLHSKQRTLVLSANNAPRYVAPGYVVFARNQALLAQRFDAGRRQVSGDPFTIGDPPAPTQYSGSPAASGSTNGVLAWLGAGSLDYRFAWLDRAGHVASTPGFSVARWDFAIPSPDGRRAIGLQRSPEGNNDVWLLDLERQTAERMIYGVGDNAIGAWAPDGRQFAYGSNRTGVRDIYIHALDGASADRLLYHSGVPFKNPDDWSPDGKWIIFEQISDATGWNLMLLPAAGGAPTPYVSTPFNEQSAQISPDGHWVSYQSDESGTPQVYVQSFPSPGSKQQVSRNGASFAIWARSGRELFVYELSGNVTAVPVDRAGAELRFGAPQTLFRMASNVRGGIPDATGQRFLVTQPAEEITPGISIAVNWRAGREGQ